MREMTFRSELPEAEQPRGVPIMPVRIEPLETAQAGEGFPGTTCPVFVDGQPVGTMLVSTFEQTVDEYGFSEIFAWVHGVARSDLRADAFMNWGDRTRGRLRVEGQEVRGIDLLPGAGSKVFLEHRAAIDPPTRGPLDADGLQRWLEPALLRDLPAPQNMDAPACMAYQHTPLRRAYRRWFPRPLSECCPYHQVHWGQASEIALQIRDQAYAIERWDRDTINEFCHTRLDELFPGPQPHLGLRDAVDSLLSRGAGITTSYDGTVRADTYGNGRHRVQVMLDQGVRRTVIVRSEYGELLATTA